MAIYERIDDWGPDLTENSEIRPRLVRPRRSSYSTRIDHLTKEHADLRVLL